MAHSQRGALVMDAVHKYKYRRINRLEKRFGAYHGPVRFDDDDDTENNSSGGGHGNTKIPFGLCKREGISIGKDWTPKDAWSALEGKGYSASEVYGELKKTGKVPAEPKEAKKPKVDLTEYRKTISEFKKNTKLKEDLTKEKEKVEIDLKKAFAKKLARENDEKRLLDVIAEYEAREYKSDFVQTRIDELKKEANECGAKRKRAEKKHEKLTKRKDEIDKQLSEIEPTLEKGKYDEAVDKMLSESPYKDKVVDYRREEEKSDGDRRELKRLDDGLLNLEQNLRLYQEKVKNAREKGDAISAKFFEEHGLAFTEKKIELWKKKREEVFSRVSAYDKKMADIKGDADAEEWDQVRELTIERDTVQEGPFTAFKFASDSLKRRQVPFIPPVKMAYQPDEKEIRDYLCGPDKTGGSCVSVALAYLANKAGYKVLDFRGGESYDYFAHNTESFVRTLGGRYEKDTNGFEVANRVLGEVEDGKEYFFACGRHAAVVRRKDGQLEYLELQDSISDWHVLNDSELGRRFNCVHKKTSYGRTVMQNAELVEASKVTSNKEFISLLGYLNTGIDQQKKGEGGGKK